MGEYWAGRHEELMVGAHERFLEAVDPAYLNQPVLSAREAETLSVGFTEWVLFECPLRRGRTPLQLFVEDLDSTAGDEDRDILCQVAVTQLFSRFAICAKDRRRDVAVLKDVRTGEVYEVLSEHICRRERWRRGSIATRIACVDGAWMSVGRMFLYDRVTPDRNATDGPGEFHPEDRVRRPELGHAGFYLRLLHDVLGADGRYRESACITASS